MTNRQDQLQASDIIEPAQHDLKSIHDALWDSIHDAVIATDDAFVITAWNKEAAKLYGWTRDEVIGKNSRELLQSRLTPKQLKELLTTQLKSLRTRFF